jgi:hypothetical protein
VVRNNYTDEIADQNLSQKDKDKSVEFVMMRIIELYVYSDLLDEIKPFVFKLDQQLYTKNNIVSLL